MDADTGDVSPATPNRSLRGFAKHLYVALFVITLVLAILGTVFRYGESLVISLPIIIIMAMAMFTDRKYVHIPPVLILMMMVTFYLSIIGRMLSDSTYVGIATSFLTGVNFGLLGLMMVYMLLRSMPGVRDENPALVSFIVMSVSISIFALVKILQYAVSLYWSGMDAVTIDVFMWQLILIIIGSLVVCIMYHADRGHRLFKYTLGGFLEENREALGLDEKERCLVLDLIKAGESEHLEFKSTLRTNLETGETDKRMEKAVLKTIVAFLNSTGGSLMIGVADDGSLIGADEQNFANRDKMGLHLTNLISSQIGNGFLPYISFNMVEFGDKVVIWVRCLECPRPVFLKDGKVEIFYVRSGPSTVELTGMNLINYVNNRRDEMVRKGRVFE